MRIDDARKRLPAPLSLRRLLKQVIILCEQYPANFQCPIQQLVIVPARRAILLRGHHLYFTPPEARGHRLADMHVHVEPDAHRFFSRAASCFRVNGTAVPLRNASARR